MPFSKINEVGVNKFIQTSLHGYVEEVINLPLIQFSKIPFFPKEKCYYRWRYMMIVVIGDR